VISVRRLEVPDEAFAGVVARFWDEAVPGERPIPLPELRAMVAYGPPNRRVHPLLAVEEGEPVGAAMLVIDELRPESASLRFLFVVPERRRRGAGSRLLRAVDERTRAAGRTRLRTLALDGHQAAAGFAGRAGARPGSLMEQSRCPVAALPVEELRSWLSPVPGYSLVAFDGVCPDEHLEAFAAVLPVMNGAPGASVDTLAPAPEQVRTMMAGHLSAGNESWTVCARDDRTGRFVGYTELSFSSHRPWHASQGDTAVDPAHRRAGIGRHLKAHTALRLLDERRDVEHIETWNAAENDAMISINRAMGFRVVATWRAWHLPVIRN
jgi:mycothiol synthase